MVVKNSERMITTLHIMHENTSDRWDRKPVSPRTMFSTIERAIGAYRGLIGQLLYNGLDAFEEYWRPPAFHCG